MEQMNVSLAFAQQDKDIMNKSTRFNEVGELNSNYMLGRRAKNVKTGREGRIVGYYTGNDKVTPRFKVSFTDSDKTSDWNEKGCVIID